MTLTQQWLYLNLTRNSFHFLFPEKGMMSYREIISSLLYVLLKELTGQALSKTVEQIKYRKCKLFEKII